MARKPKSTKQEVQKKLEDLPTEMKDLLTERRHLVLKKSKLQGKIVGELEKTEIEDVNKRILEIDNKFDDYYKKK